MQHLDRPDAGQRRRRHRERRRRRHLRVDLHGRRGRHSRQPDLQRAPRPATARSPSRRRRRTACSSSPPLTFTATVPDRRAEPDRRPGPAGGERPDDELAARPDVHRRADPDDRQVELAGPGHDPQARRPDHVHDGRPEHRSRERHERRRQRPGAGEHDLRELLGRDARAAPRPARSHGRSARSRPARPRRSRSPSARARRLPISDTPYTISNTATVDFDRDADAGRRATPSRTSSRCSPTIVKSVSATEAAPGDTLTYTLSVSNPGAAFTGDVSDVVPAGHLVRGQLLAGLLVRGGHGDVERRDDPARHVDVLVRRDGDGVAAARP